MNGNVHFSYVYKTRSSDFTDVRSWRKASSFEIIIYSKELCSDQKFCPKEESRADLKNVYDWNGHWDVKTTR